MKNIYNLAQGTIIVEDVLNPRAAPALLFQAFENLMSEMGMTVDMAGEIGLDPPPSDATGYEIPALTSWSDIAYLQLVHASGGNQNQVQGVKRIIQFHVSVDSCVVQAWKTLTGTPFERSQTQLLRLVKFLLNRHYVHDQSHGLFPSFCILTLHGRALIDTSKIHEPDPGLLLTILADTN